MATGSGARHRFFSWLGTGALGGVATLLAACDDGTAINRVEILNETHSYFSTAGAAGMATEVYGTPFARVEATQVVASLRPPPGMAQDIRFRLVAQGEVPEAPRLVLVFNRTDVVDSAADCRRSYHGQPVPVDPQPQAEVGFTVTATLCHADARVTTGNMVAAKTRADDPEEFARVMRLLLIAITRQES